MELNVVDQLSRRGYRLSGHASIQVSGVTFEKAVAMVVGEEKAPYPVKAVVMLDVMDAAPLVSPGYWYVDDEHSMRAASRDRRRCLEEEFESHLAAEGPFRVGR